MLRVLRVLALLMLGACSQPTHFNATDISGADWGHDFRLTGHDGKPHQLADFKGKAVALFFGYTQCPDVCPTTLAGMAAAMKLLGADAERVQVLFVTLDPERDTPDVQARYVTAFNATFLGLSGDLATTAATAKEFKVFYQKQAQSPAGGYTIDHTAATFIFDPAGRLRLYVPYGAPPANIAADIKQLLTGK